MRHSVKGWKGDAMLLQLQSAAHLLGANTPPNWPAGEQHSFALACCKCIDSSVFYLGHFPHQGHPFTFTS